MGNSKYSLNKIRTKSNRTYYNILIDDENFYSNSKSFIKDQVLYDNQIVPLNNENKVYGHVIDEMDEFIISLFISELVDFSNDHVINRMIKATLIFLSCQFISSRLVREINNLLPYLEGVNHINIGKIDKTFS